MLTSEDDHKDSFTGYILAKCIVHLLGKCIIYLFFWLRILLKVSINKTESVVVFL